MTKTNLERIREEFEKAVTINIDMKPVLMYGKRATDEISDFWIKRFETLLQQRMDEIAQEIEKIDSSDGSGMVYRKEVLNIIKSVDKNK